MNLRSITIAAGSFVALTAAALAGAQLKIGDEAPAIKTGEWVQGDPVKEFSKDKVYVVEFWATWCGPCVATIPHLDTLHEAFKDKGVVFIGQNCWERDLSKVKPFVEKMGEKMSYRVATDDTTSEDKGFMAVNWMQAAGQSGIPCAFVVGKDGRIVWIGHPASLQEDILTEVVAGTFDTKKAAERQAKEDAAKSVMQKKGRKFAEAMQKKDWDTASAVLDEMEKELPDMATQLSGARLNIAMNKGDSAAVVKLVEQSLTGPAGDSPQLLNQIAWGIATELKDPSPEALEAACKAATKGVEKSKGDAALLDTLARIQFLQGKKDEAVKTQEQAVSKSDEKLKDQMEETLQSYKEGKLPAAK